MPVVYEAMYKGVMKGTMRVNNGTPNYEKFEAGVPKQVTAEMAKRLGKMPKDFLVRELKMEDSVAENAPAVAAVATGKKKLLKK